jgi:hypothetical protein
VELQNAKARFEEQGIGLAAISYDSRAILKDIDETGSFATNISQPDTQTDSPPMM